MEKTTTLSAREEGAIEALKELRDKWLKEGVSGTHPSIWDTNEKIEELQAELTPKEEQ